MKQRIWIVLLLVFCVGLVCFGAYSLCSTKHEPEVSTAAAADQKAPHIAGLDRVKALPSVESQECEYEGFRLSFNKHNRTPNWVAWELLGSETYGESSRSNKFWQDPDVEGCPTTNDYRNSGYDRGHMCPAADQKWSQKAMEDCFVMANMCPQDHALNAGAWNTLEGRERDWARRDSALVIVAGPIYSAEDRQTIGGGVLVPGAFFKVILAPYLEQPRAIAFVYPNMSAPGNMQNYVVTVDEVEKLTGLDFFSALPDDIENEVESKSSFREWNRR
ncbi:MAG: DNA/RNA non-specific endonuclease [Bacteroides sp.]|nr:DNA/RNA non-specific endonuclease [Bacteroides sp.]